MIFGSGVMVNMFTLRVIDQGLSLNQVNPKTKICICYFSAKHGALSELKTGWPRIRIICANGTTFLTCCLREVTQKNFQLSLLVQYKMDINISSKCYLFCSHLEYVTCSLVIWNMLLVLQSSGICYLFSSHLEYVTCSLVICNMLLVLQSSVICYLLVHLDQRSM